MPFLRFTPVSWEGLGQEIDILCTLALIYIRGTAFLHCPDNLGGSRGQVPESSEDVDDG